MSPRALALGAIAAASLGVAAQYVAPAWPGFHTWQYAAALALAAVAACGYALDARKGEDGEPGRRLVVAVAGAVVTIAAGLGSGLLGPDTQLVARAPGTVAPLAGVGAAAFFPIASADEIARGSARIVLRRPDAPELDIGPGERRYVGASAVDEIAELAAAVEVHGPSGDRLTVTQPTSSAFLSPVLLFPQTVPIAGKSLPSDAFAVPAVHRQVKAFYFSPQAAATTARGHDLGGKPAVLFAVDDENGTLLPGGIGFAPTGVPVALAGLRLTATVGAYPALRISAVPSPAAFWLGIGLTVAGAVWAFAVPVAVRRDTSGGRALPQAP